MATVLALVGDEGALFSLQDILRTFGHVLVPVTDADDALRLVEGQNHDLLLLDVNMEGLDAVLTVQKILGIRPRAQIAAITAYPKEPLSQAILEAGAHSLMRKPYEVGRILHLLEDRKQGEVPDAR